MRRAIVFLFSVIVVISFGAEIKIKDVSPVLDIYEPVSFMIENKIMELDENGNFRGGLLTTR
ncbi:MAG: S-layer homology domain-containing protein, partial [Pseudothermotoga sp.]